MGILHGSLVMRKIKFRTTLLFTTLNLWLNQIGDILLDYFKQGIDARNSAETAYVNTKNFITESWLWGKAFKNSTESISSLDQYTILYYVLVSISIFFWVQIVYALFFAIEDYGNKQEVTRKKSKKYIYLLIAVMNIAIYLYLNVQIYNTL